MRRSILLLLLPLLALACNDAPSPTTTPPVPDKAAEVIAPEDWGKVDTLAGEGTLKVCAPECAPAAQGAGILVGATIQTDEVVRAAVQLVDDSRLEIDAGSRIVVQDRGQLQLEQGRVLVETPTTVKIDTPAGQMTLERGKVAVRAETAPDGSARTRISVLSGNGTLQSGADQKALAAGESAMAEGGEVSIRPSASLAYQTAWAQELRVEAEANEGDEAARGIGNIYGKNPATRQELAEAITIKSLSVHTTVYDRIARTEVEQVFKNTTRQTLEGYYTFPIPQDASIVRFAMEVNGQMMEGELVEKQRAVKIFDQIVADYIRPRDPALLEWKGGNTFQMRIFPIFGGGEPRVILWYTQVLPADSTETRYTYPLPRTGKVAIDQFTYTADLQTSQRLSGVRTPMYASSVDLGAQNTSASVRFEKSGFSPRHDLVMEWEQPQYAPAAVYTGRGPESDAGPYFMMVLRPDLLRTATATPNAVPERRRDHVFIVDTSYGMAEGDLKAQSAAVATWLAHLGPDDRFNIVAGNQTMTTFGQGLQSSSTDNVQQAIAFLEGQKPGGASHIEGMFAASARLLADAVDPVVIYVGDGHATLGETKPEALVDAIEGAFGTRRPTIHAVGIGADVDPTTLQRLTRRFGGFTEVLNRGEDVPRRVEALALSTGRRSLRQATIAFSSDQIEAVYPRFVPTLRQGEELVVVGRFKGEVDGQVTLSGLVGDEPFAQPFAVRLSEPSAQRNSFVPRIWAQRHIEHLTQDEGSAARDAIVATSTRHTVMSRYTAFLVLESERMYKEFQVNRNKDRAYPDAKPEPVETAKDAKAADKAEEAPMAASDEAPDADAAAANVPADVTAEPFADRSSRATAETAGEDAPMGGVDGADPELAQANRGGGGMSDFGDAGAGKGGGMAAPRPAPAKKTASRARGGRIDMFDLDLGGGGGGGGGGGRRYRYEPPRPYAVIQSVSAEPPAPTNDAVKNLQAQIDAEPLRRDFRRRMVKFFVQRGDTASALEATRSWLDKDPSSAEAHWRFADLLARSGETERAELHFGNAVELAPTDASALRRWAEHFDLRGQYSLAVAARKALLSQAADVGDELALVASWSHVEPAAARARLQRLRGQSGLSREQQKALDALEVQLQQGQASAPKADLRGTGVVTLSWEGDADLDLSVVLPYGERISADVPSSSVAKGKRGRVVASADKGHASGSARKEPLEAIVMAWAPVGQYRIEVVRRGEVSAPVKGTVTIQMLGERRTFEVVVPSGDRDIRVADVEVQMRAQKYHRGDWNSPF